MNLADGTNPLLEAGEAYVTYTLSPSMEAIALGLTIESIAPYEPVETDTTLQIWVSVDEDFWEDAAFLGAGTSLSIELTIETDSIPPRRWQRTVVLKVAQQ
jgi:hypothetical protein